MIFSDTTVTTIVANFATIVTKVTTIIAKVTTIVQTVPLWSKLMAAVGATVVRNNLRF